MHIRGRRFGQAAIECAIGLFIFALILSALVGFAPVFLKNFKMQSEARCDAGIDALAAGDGSEALGSTAAITSLSHVPPAAGVDPWQYPVQTMPHEEMFRDWRDDAVSGGRLVHGGRKKSFRFRMFADGKMLVDEEGRLAEDVFMPAMGGGRTSGGGL